MRDWKEAVLVGAVLVGTVTPANAGPNFVEGLCPASDAGSVPGTACNTIGGFGVLLSIAGNTALGFGPPSEDMYLIFINDAANFSATTEDPSTTFDTRLWLFGLDGVGLLANDDTAGGQDAMLGPMSTDGLTVITEGLHYLAISGGDGMPGLDPGRFPFDGGGFPSFIFTSAFDIAGPNPLAGPVVGWTGAGQVGEYVIHLTGVSFVKVPAPGAAAVLVLGLFGRGARRRR